MNYKEKFMDHAQYIQSFPADIQKAMIKIEDKYDEDIRNIYPLEGKSHDEVRDMLGVGKGKKPKSPYACQDYSNLDKNDMANIMAAWVKCMSEVSKRK